MTSSRTPAWLCYACGCKLDSASAIEGSAAPQLGDIGACINCGAPHVFGEGLQRRPMTDQDWIEMSRSDREMLHRAMNVCAQRRVEDGDLGSGRSGNA